MTSITGTVHNGKIEVPAPPDWPEGCEVVIEPLARSREKIGLDESQWRDDPAALADWEQWLQTIEPPEFTPEEEVARAQFELEMKRFNVEAVRRQMQEEPL